MAIGINTMDDDLDDIQSNENLNLDLNVETNGEDTSIISDFLKTRGIEDINQINLQEDDGTITTRAWNDLTKEELFNILNTPIDNNSSAQQDYQHENTDLTDEEIQLLNLIRKSNMTPSLYLSQFQPQEPIYKIDDLSDDELYILDLESRVGELTDDLAVQALGVAKLNEELYKKQVDGIRKEYKEREDFLAQQDLAKLESEQQEAYQQYSNNIINAIDSFNSVGNLDLNLEDSDKNDLADFMLSQDESGYNYLYQALQDPQTLVKAAWFILNGDEAFNNITDYFTNLIKLVSENLYKRGLEDGKKGVSSKSTVVIQPNRQEKTQKISKIEDLFDDIE